MASPRRRNSLRVWPEPDTIKKQLERLVKNRRIINAGYGKYGLSEHQRKGFAAMVALRKVHETDGTKSVQCS